MTVERVTSITAISLSVPAFGPASCVRRESVRFTHGTLVFGRGETGSHRRQCHAHDFGAYRQVLDLGSAAENSTCKVAAESLRIRERWKAEDPGSVQEGHCTCQHTFSWETYSSSSTHGRFLSWTSTGFKAAVTTWTRISCGFKSAGCHIGHIQRSARMNVRLFRSHSPLEESVGAARAYPGTAASSVTRPGRKERVQGTSLL